MFGSCPVLVESNLVPVLVLLQFLFSFSPIHFHSLFELVWIESCWLCRRLDFKWRTFCWKILHFSQTSPVDKLTNTTPQDFVGDRCCEVGKERLEVCKQQSLVSVPASLLDQTSIMSSSVLPLFPCCSVFNSLLLSHSCLALDKAKH